ncbi:MAG: nitronate monooxygenase [Deltaproteobacteria bacterium]|nr:nitronate monooxygenase [Candidatus Zymogenaceae bacterium]
MIKTAITEMFGVKYPIICGAMMWLSIPPLAGAISKAGGLGNLTAGNYETEQEFRNAIKEVRKITDKPFMVGITILPSLRITPEHHAMYVKVCAEERVAGVEISGAPLDKGLGMDAVEMLKKANVKMFQKVGAVRHAVHAEKVGYDGIYAAGIEEGGHPLSDDVSTMVLTPRIAETVNIPVVTVGGVADGRGLAAAIVLGAHGVMMGSRFVSTKECPCHDNIKEELVRRQEMDTTIFGRSIGLQGRALMSDVIRDVIAIEEKGGKLEDLIPLISGLRIKQAWETGDVNYAPLMVGQSIGLIKKVLSVKEMMESMVKDAEDILAARNKMVC